MYRDDILAKLDMLVTAVLLIGSVAVVAVLVALFINGRRK